MSYSVDKEPNVLVASDFWYGGVQANIPPGTETPNSGGGWLSSIVVPPHVTVELKNWPTVVTDPATGKGYWGKDIAKGSVNAQPFFTTELPPGAYPALGYLPTKYCADGKCVDYAPQNWNDMMLSMYARIDKPWKQFVQDCCSKVESADRCQNLFGPTSGNGQCNPSMLAYCTESTTNMNNPVCTQWMTENPNYTNVVRTAVCNRPGALDGPDGKTCRTFCKLNPGSCDDSAYEYCQRTPKDPFCYCITSPVKRYNPACVDVQCIAGTDPERNYDGVGGYVTASMKAMGRCPNVVDCSTQILLQAGGRATTGNITTEQNCGQDQYTTPEPTPITPVPAIPTPSQPVTTVPAGTHDTPVLITQTTPDAQPAVIPAVGSSLLTPFITPTAPVSAPAPTPAPAPTQSAQSSPSVVFIFILFVIFIIIGIIFAVKRFGGKSKVAIAK